MLRLFLNFTNCNCLNEALKVLQCNLEQKNQILYYDSIYEPLIDNQKNYLHQNTIIHGFSKQLYNLIFKC